MFVDFFTIFLFSHFWQLKVSETTSLEFGISLFGKTSPLKKHQLSHSALFQDF
jgi:hypothetical protein